MFTWRRSIGLASVLVASAALASGPGTHDPFSKPAADALNELARKGGVTKEHFRVDPATMELEMTFSGRFRLQSYVMQQPSRAPGILEVLAMDVREGTGIEPRLETLASLARPEGARPHRPALSPDVLEKVLRSPTPIQAAIEQVYNGTKKRFQGKDLENVSKNEATLPDAVSEQAARLILATLEATLTRQAVVKESDFRSGGAFDSRSKRTAEQLRQFLSGWWEDPGGKSAFMAVEPTLDSYNLSALYQGALKLAGDLDRSATDCQVDGFAEGAPAEFHYQWTTPRGEIAIGGAGENTYRGDFILILDLMACGQPHLHQMPSQEPRSPQHENLHGVPLVVVSRGANPPPRLEAGPVGGKRWLPASFCRSSTNPGNRRPAWSRSMNTATPGTPVRKSDLVPPSTKANERLEAGS